jgi:hypothetical protein
MIVSSSDADSYVYTAAEELWLAVSVVDDLHKADTAALSCHLAGIVVQWKLVLKSCLLLLLLRRSGWLSFAVLSFAAVLQVMNHMLFT